MRCASRPLAALLLASAAIAAGCGSESTSEGSALVDPGVDPPINSLEADPAGEGLLLTTNRGFFRISDGAAEPVESSATTPDGKTSVGTFLALAVDGDRLIGSGHPDKTGRIADFLGSLVSDDDGRTWTVSSRYAISDLHVIRPMGETIYAFDAIIDGLLTSDDGGRNWTEHGGPPEQVIDFVVDPADPDHLIASTPKELFRSTDGGKRWSATVSARNARFAWPEPGVLRRTDEDGLVYASGNSGASWELIGRIDGEPWKLLATSAEQLYAALADATIVESSDGGESWQEHFQP